MGPARSTRRATFLEQVGLEGSNATCSDEKLCIVAAVEEVGNQGKGPVRAVWKAGEEIPAFMAQQCPDHKKLYDFGGTDACSVN